MDIKPLILEAERLLRANPRDGVHGLDHHLRVWDGARGIVESLDEEVDREALQVAVMWHDVMISPESLSLGAEGLLAETVGHLAELMEKEGFEVEFRDKVLEAIRHHNFLTRRQMNVEGKVLFDADKLDALNPIRYLQIVESVKSRKLSKLQIFAYTKAAKLWLRTMRKRYHFEASRERHDELIEGLLADRETVEFARELGVDIEGLVG